LGQTRAAKLLPVVMLGGYSLFVLAMLLPSRSGEASVCRLIDQLGALPKVLVDRETGSI
jgi:hypothetical protein